MVLTWMTAQSVTTGVFLFGVDQPDEVESPAPDLLDQLIDGFGPLVVDMLGERLERLFVFHDGLLSAQTLHYAKNL